MDNPTPTQRHRLRLQGLVQGVGFRPHVYALALHHQLVGFVYNDKQGVVVEAQGEKARLEAFETALQTQLPPLARLDSLHVEVLACQTDTAFVILQSPQTQTLPLLSVGPDMAPCEACLQELFCTTERRYLYPFLNCTHCGPRYTATLRLPWDRPHTSLSAFPMCQACTLEYENPKDRRFHAEAIACPNCGPQLEEGLQPFVRCINEGGIVALKATGGFQLACDATNEAAVLRLRQRKMREGKPLALMLPTLATARHYAVLSTAEEALLQSPQRPIVLVRKREEATPTLAPSLAPALAHLGLCLPSTPLHYALFYEALGRPTSPAWLEKTHGLAWVMTSANVSGEPLAKTNEEALRKLHNVADAFVLHNRPITARMDDSLLQMVDGAPQMLRRARGYVPHPLPLPWSGPPLLAVGGQLKSTFCLVHNNRAYLSQHLGDLDNPEARASFCENIEWLCTQLKLKPELLAADLHPGYFSTQWAAQKGLECLYVQHHVAHIAAVWAEHPHVKAPLLGLALDGTGLGTDGLPWGGELLGVGVGVEAEAEAEAPPPYTPSPPAGNA